MMKRFSFVAFLFLCFSLTAFAQTSKIETGEINGAPFRIEVPANWNKGLIMYCHGYETVGAKTNVADPKPNPVRDEFIKRGFAVAQSAYSTQGWAVKEGVEDTESLRKYFVKKYGQPGESIVLGHSMGGVITVATIEKYPEVYDGALPMCGPLVATVNGFQRRLFDMLVTFEFYFPGTIGDVGKVAPDAKLNTIKVKNAMQADPAKAAMFAKRFSLKTPLEVMGVLDFFYKINAELQQRTGGNPFDTRNSIYGGFEDDVVLNRGVKRYTADAKAREYLRQHYSPTGRIADPVLTIHTTYDQLVTAADVLDYESVTKLAGTQDLLVAKFVVANGHCAFSPAQTGSAFDELLQWIRNKKKPEAGEIK
jgi:pimeloyl-ACP methyl ester carboxylesterase